MNKKTLVLIVFLILIVIFIAILSLNNKQKTNNPVVITGPTPTSNTKPSPANLNELLLVNVDPPEDPTGLSNASSVNRITFTFNKSVDPTSLQISTNPQVNLEKVFLENSTKLVIQPDKLDLWKPNVLYTVTINKNLRASDDFTLKQDIVYKLKVVIQGGE